MQRVEPRALLDGKVALVTGVGVRDRGGHRPAWLRAEGAGGAGRHRRSGPDSDELMVAVRADVTDEVAVIPLSRPRWTGLAASDVAFRRCRRGPFGDDADGDTADCAGPWTALHGSYLTVRTPRRSGRPGTAARWCWCRR
ncbi:hypothetical protein HBB16_19990 [Pseudonocardia sp. MCCB 268]|nr:hypothetical protein [Pseudonocardia cytotoxica]